MGELLGHLVDAPLANVIVLAGLGFLAVGAIGKVSASINPSVISRVISGVVGIALLFYGLNAHVSADAHTEHASREGTATATVRPARPPIGSISVPPPSTRQPQQAPETCRLAYVWREAFAGDHVCVTPDVHVATARQNELAPSRHSPNGGAYGPDSCRQGFVWRDAKPGDHVCVTGLERQQAAADNQAAASRRIG